MNDSVFNFNPEWPCPDEDVREALLAMARDGSWGRYHGPHCQTLSVALSEFHSAEHCHLTCSGTAAVELALRACGVSSGDEVILSAYDFKANFVNVLALGALPVLVDVVPETPVIDITKLEAAMSPATRAIVVSHLHGFHAPMRDLMQMAQNRRIPVIEDACQNPGAIVDGRIAGTWGDAGILSFGGSKLLSAGRGGAIVTSRPDLAQRLQLHTQRGNDAYPLSEMQAAVLLPQLKRLPQRNQIRVASVQNLIRQFSSNAAIMPVVISEDAKGSKGETPAYYKLPFLLRHPPAADVKQSLVDAYHAASIVLSPGFSALHRIHARSRYRAAEELSCAEDFANRLLTLHHPVLLQPERTIAELAKRILDISTIRL